jgi:beta-lactam-binding protein with PASTA domain
MASTPDPRPPDLDEPTVADEEWPVAELYRIEPDVPGEKDDLLLRAAEAAPPTRRRFPPELHGRLAAVLVGVLLVALLVPAGIWLAARGEDDEPSPTRPVQTTTDAAASAPTASPAESAEKPAPDVTGLTLPEARARLEDAGLQVRFRREPSERPTGEVLAQDPAAGTTLPANALVVLTVAGTERIAVPDVVGRSVDDATAALRDAGLRFRTRLVRSNEPAETVVEQSPTAGEVVETDAVVVLEIARAPAPPPEPATIEVPNLVGRTSSEARIRLRSLGLRSTQHPVVSEQPKGTIVGQSPGAGAELREGGTVTLRVSTGPGQVQVPDVIALDEQAAIGELEAAGFEVRVVDRPTSVADENGLVVDQSPAAGVTRAERSVVTITVARLADR